MTVGEDGPDADTRSGNRRRPRGILSAVAVGMVLVSPALMLVGAGLAAAAQPPGYDPIRQSVSTLGRLGATDRWIMTGTLVLLGAGYLAGALTLTRVPLRGRVVLGIGGGGTLLAGLLPQPETGSSVWHMTAATVGWIAFVCWPLAASRHPATSPLLGRRVAWIVTGALAVLLAWFFVQLRTGGAHLGLSERVLIVAQMLWPAVVVLAVRWDAGSAARRPGDSRTAADAGARPTR